MNETLNIEIPNIEYNENSFAEIQEVTTVNNRKIYKTNLYGCLKYISLDKSVVYISIKYGDTIHIFNLKDDGEFSDIKKQFENNIAEIKNNPNYHANRINSSITYGINNLKWVNDLDDCSKVINLDAAKEYVNILNKELNTTCPNFRINLDYIFDLPEHSIIDTYNILLSNLSDYADSLLLCLFYNNHCVSSLTIKLINNKIFIDSKTNPIYKRRKFNKLLRAVLIIIAKLIDKNIHYVVSEALNPISAYLMINSFNATATNYDDQTITVSKFEDIVDEIIKNYSLILKVELNEPNIQKAQQVFNETVANINCSEPKTNTVSDTIGGNKKRKKTRKKRRIKNKKRKTKRR
jgi:hypothetical protein